MQSMSRAFLLRDRVVHLAAGPLATWTNDARFWSERARPELATGHMMSIFDYTDTWGYQERHPTGDELAVVLSGSIDFLLDDGDGERPVRVGPGRACVVPAGAWHRVAVLEPSTILFVTPTPAQTEERPVR